MDFLSQLISRSQPKYGGLILLGILILSFMAGTIIWLKQDTSPATDPDANLYMERTLAFIDRLPARNIFEAWTAIEDLHMEGRPPLYQLISIPFIWAFGRTMDSGVYVNLLFSSLLFIAIYNIGKIIVDEKAGLLAVVITAGYPTLISLAHNYRPYFAVAACVALNIWLLLLLQKHRTVTLAWLFGLSIAFGFWIYPLFLWVSPIPATLFCIYIVFFESDPPRFEIRQLRTWFIAKLRERMVLYGLIPASLVSIALVLSWYQTNAAVLLVRIQNWARSPAVAEFRGAKVITLGFYDIDPSFMWYALTSPSAISTVFVVLLLIGIAMGLRRHTFYDIILLTFFGIGYIALSLQGGLGWRYFSMLLPVAALLTGVWIGRIKNKILFNTLLFLCLVVSALNFSIINWGIQPWNAPIVDYLGVISGKDSDDCATAPGWGFCPSSPLKANWPVNDILATIQDDPDCEPQNCTVLAVFRTDYMRFTVYPYYLRQDFQQRTVTIQSPGNPIMGMPLDLAGLLNSNYIVYESMPSPEGTSYDEYLIRFLLSQPAEFTASYLAFAEYEMPNGHVAKVIKRIKPPTVVEAQQVIDAIDAPEKYKLMQYDVLASLYAKNGDFDKAKAYYQEGLSTGEIFKHFALTDIQYIETLIANQKVINAQQKAINEYQAILESDPDNYEAHTELARIFQELNDCGNAIPHLKAHLETEKSYTTYADLGDAYLKCEDWRNAIDVYRSALEYSDNAPRAYFGLAMALAADGQEKEAARVFKKVIKYAPGSDYAQQAQEWLDSH